MSPPAAHRARPAAPPAATSSGSSLSVQGDRVADAGFAASGCGATIAAGSAAVTLVRGRPLLEAARVGAEAISRELGGLSAGKLHAADLASDALHRALGAAVAASARCAPDPGRTLVAMSGGVDSAVAAAAGPARRARRGRRDAGAVGRRGERRPAQLLLGRRGARRARGGPRDGDAPSHARPARRLPRRRGRPLPRRPRRGGDAEPVHPLQRSRAPRRDARPRAPARRGATSPPGTTRAWSTTARARCCAPPPTPRRTRPTCSPR